MKSLITLLTVLILSGCAEHRVVPPDWEIAAREVSQTADPLPLPLLCEIPWSTVECWAAVEEYEVVAESNTAIAAANTDALRNMEAAYDALVQAGKLQRELAIYREELLAEERKLHFYDNLFHRAIIFVGLAGAAL